MNFDELRNRTIGTVEYVSSREIKVLLETNAPQSTAINTGVPQSFPKINGYVLIPSEDGALIGIISWIGIEYSSYPKRKGYKDFDLVDLPFPTRKLSVSPVGVLKQNENGYFVERGVFSYPSVGDTVAIPSNIQLKAIVENKDANAKIKIGISPMAANENVYVNPDKLFGRHLAVLGNTGSGKSCSVAGLIRWSIEAAKNEADTLNCRFLVLDPNDEYNSCFDDLGNVRKYKVIIDNNAEENKKQLKIPSWMWNSYEWSAVTRASDKSQRPLLRKALRDMRIVSDHNNDSKVLLRRYYSSILIDFQTDLRIGVSKFKGKPGKNEFGKKLQSVIEDIENDLSTVTDEMIQQKLETLKIDISKIEKEKHKSFISTDGEKIEYYDDFSKNNLICIISALKIFVTSLGGVEYFKGPNVDSPIFFSNELFMNHIEQLCESSISATYMDFFIMRIRTLLSDIRIASIINTETPEEISLEEWLNKYIGSNQDNGTINIFDLSLIPSEILFIVVSVLARITFEAHQRYRRMNGNVLPTTIVVEEAHNFIKQYSDSTDEISATQLCTQSFEKIAKEGRKFGLGLLLSSQRPAELSPTVLSQCNTFLLHRLVNDRDQDMVKRLVPDSLGGILNELPILPTKKAILLGWAAPIPTLVEMNDLFIEHRPKSNDPDFWNVWTGKEKREINWEKIVEEWQRNYNKKIEKDEDTDPKDIDF